MALRAAEAEAVQRQDGSALAVEQVDVGGLDPQQALAVGVVAGRADVAPQVVVGGRAAGEVEAGDRERDRQPAFLLGHAFAVDGERDGALQAGVQQPGVDLVAGRVLVQLGGAGVADQGLVAADPGVGDPAERGAQVVAQGPQVAVEVGAGQVPVGGGDEGPPVGHRPRGPVRAGGGGGHAGGQVLLPAVAGRVEQAVHGHGPGAVARGGLDGLQVVALALAQHQGPREVQVLQQHRGAAVAQGRQDGGGLRGAGDRDRAVQAVVGQVGGVVGAALGGPHPAGERR